MQGWPGSCCRVHDVRGSQALLPARRPECGAIAADLRHCMSSMQAKTALSQSSSKLSMML